MVSQTKIIKAIMTPSTEAEIGAMFVNAREAVLALQALKEMGGNRSRAAKHLGISRATFYRRLQQLGIDQDR